MRQKAYKPKICKAPGCGKAFIPWSTTQRVCNNFRCAIAYNRIKDAQALEKEKRKWYRREKERLKTLSDWLREAQEACNAYIRKRDGDKPCVSCGRYHSGQYHAGHYRSIGACPELRYHPANIHKQCSACNNHLSGNAVEYRLSLLNRIGPDMVEWLEGPHQPQRLRIEDAKEIKTYYKEQLKWLVK